MIRDCQPPWETVVS